MCWDVTVWQSCKVVKSLVSLGCGLSSVWHLSLRLLSRQQILTEDWSPWAIHLHSSHTDMIYTGTPHTHTDIIYTGTPHVVTSVQCCGEPWLSEHWERWEELVTCCSPPLTSLYWFTCSSQWNLSEKVENMESLCRCYTFSVSRVDSLRLRSLSLSLSL